MYCVANGSRCGGFYLAVSLQRLVEALAFLSNDSEDVNHIPALCVQENQESSFLSVLTAVNQTDWRDT
jgi:hypothetical protein